MPGGPHTRHRFGKVDYDLREPASVVGRRQISTCGPGPGAILTISRSHFRARCPAHHFSVLLSSTPAGRFPVPRSSKNSIGMDVSPHTARHLSGFLLWPATTTLPGGLCSRRRPFTLPLGLLRLSTGPPVFYCPVRGASLASRRRPVRGAVVKKLGGRTPARAVISFPPLVTPLFFEGHGRRAGEYPVEARAPGIPGC